QHFWQLMHADSSPDIASKQATDWFYKLSCDCDYVRLNAIRRDVKWTVPTQWGDLEITINRSKPEKDPRAIAAALKNPRPKENEPYPACQLCFENEGYWGRSVDSANGSHPARHNLRVVPITLNHEDWGLQYSPYAYYREHCIVMNRQHIPMHVDVENITRLLDFVDMFPHYFVGSNAGLPIVGGSILTHDHFQGGRYEFPLDKAPVIEKIELSKNDFAEVEAGIVRWPLTVIRLKSRSREQLLKAAGHILGKWQDFSDAEAGLIAHEPDGTSHNAVTPYAHKEDGVYRLDLALRNNQTSPERPMGIFHPREELHHIKRENIGLIEVAGMAILPGRLIAEMDALQKAIQEDPTLMRDYAETPIQKHILWAQELMRAYESSHGATPTGEDLHDLLYQGIGEVFAQVLEDCAVFSQTPTGQVSLKRFLTTL
ncbi:MAG: UDP-glucose--hexose-1-phosphate uridylyltransferase, partial [Coriobacteriales bacterium]|nr:UDP-glucose--hexose-1-phosphate uridylyltransferase [Coriobacteriales bacterium]